MRMFDISMGEMICALLVAILVMKPEDAKSLSEAIKNLIMRYQYFKNSILKEVGILEINDEELKPTHYVLDEEGKTKPAYDLYNRKVKNDDSQ